MFVAFSKLVVILSTPSVTLAVASAATFAASVKFPSNNNLTAFPKFGISSKRPLSLLVIFSFIRFAKSAIAFLGFSKTEITSSPKSEIKS